MSDINSSENLIQANSPDGGFLQSEEWRKFQESFGRKTFTVASDNFQANIIEHDLPIVGKYFYIPRGPVIAVSNFQFLISNQIPNANDSIKKNIIEVIKLARENNANWIRFDANNPGVLDFIQDNFPVVIKAPHDMQPKEIFVIDITKSEEDLLAEMKPKTRYNIKIAQKHNVSIAKDKKYLDDFLRLIKITAIRDKIAPHPDEYYKKMFETIPEENIKLYVAQYQKKVIAANIVVFYGKVATYLHGASDNEYRNVMAPHLLQWQAILDAKKVRCEQYDLGGVKTEGSGSWAGITRFKTGFSANIEPIKCPGSYDIVLNTFKYNLYKILQRVKDIF